MIAGRRLPAPGASQRAFDWLHGTATGVFALAVAVGAGAGFGAIVFRLLIIWFTQLFTGHSDYSAVGRAFNPHVPALGMWFVVLAPVVGGLIYGPVIHRFAREARGHGVPEVMLAVAERGGRIRPQVAVIKSVASALCIGSGGSVGREGPIVQIGSALGSTMGQALRVPDKRLRLLVACGAAGGISATFNAPIAGVFFALELILQDFAVESFGAVVLASVTADIIGRAAFGSHPFLALPPFHIASPWEYGLYAVLGLLGGIVGVGFIRVLYGSEDVADRVWRGPEWLRPAVGGVLLGLLLLALPQLYGVGYPVIQNAAGGSLVLWLLAALLAGKMLATSVTIAIGGSGGVFAPSLFMGAMLGGGFGEVVRTLFHGSVAPPGAYALVGMGAVFAGAARAPITAVIIIFELTGDYTIILPMMIAIAIAAGLSTLLSRDTIYTLKLRRRGIDVFRGRGANLMHVLSVRDAMREVPQPLGPDATLDDIIARFAQRDINALPVVDSDGAYRGTVSARQVEAAMQDNAIDMTAADLAETPAALNPEMDLERALTVLVRQERSALPVVDGSTHELVGWMRHADLLTAYNRRLQNTVATSTQRSVTMQPDATPPPASGVGPSAVPGLTLPPLKDYTVLEIQLGRRGAAVGRRVADIAWPPQSVVIAVRRGERVHVPDGRTRLLSGDRLTLLVRREDADGLPQRLGAE